MSFNEIVGQEFVKASLQNSIKDDRISHAYIFEGSEGIGKKYTANIFAKALVCSDNKTGDSCGVCNNCIKSKHCNHPDIKVISDKTSIKIETVREIIKDIYIKPYMARKKVYIIEDAYKLTLQAQNSLLKVLEEPPMYGVIILTTYSAKSLLKTIQSRSILLRFKPHTEEEINNYLSSKFGYLNDNTKIITAFSEGTFGKAEEIAKWDEFNCYRLKTKEILYDFFKNENDVLEKEDFFLENKQNIDTILKILIFWFRDIFFIKEMRNSNLIINKDEMDAIIEISQKITAKGIIKVIEEIIYANKKLKANANYSLTIDTMLLKCYKAINN